MSRPHYCYFHKDNSITNFCTLAQCTLPMCPDCLPIHSQEHQHRQDSSAIITFHAAEQRALAWIRARLTQLTKTQAESVAVLRNTEDLLLKEVRQYIQRQEQELGKMSSERAEWEKKLCKIQKKSLKTLIYFYSDSHTQSPMLESFSAFCEQQRAKVEEVTRSLSSSLGAQIQKFEVKGHFLEPERKAFTHESNKALVINKSNEGIDFTHKEQSKEIFEVQRVQRTHQVASEQEVRKRSHTEMEQENRKRSHIEVEEYEKKATERSNRIQHLKTETIHLEGRSSTRSPHTRLEYDRRDDSEQKKPLKPSDLNLRWEEKEANRVEMNKEVLSPQQIRRMLEKRIEERSRILSKKKAVVVTPGKEESSVQERNWDTKDSIINQIYHDYRY